MDSKKLGALDDALPHKWDNIIIKGKSFNTMLEMSNSKIREILELNGVTRIVVPEFIRGYDISIQCFKTRGILGNSKNYQEILNVMEINQPIAVLESDELIMNFQDILLENSKNKRFISQENFCFNMDGTKLATKDFRILIDDFNGNIPKELLLHVGSIAFCMLTGIIDYPIGYDYIKSIMLRYGETEFFHFSEAYLHITIGREANDINIKSFKLDQSSKF